MSGVVYFLPDFVLARDISVAFTGAVPLSFTIRKGTWFCNALAAWTWLMLKHLEVSGSDCSLVFYDRVPDGGPYQGTIYCNNNDADEIRITGDSKNTSDAFGYWLGMYNQGGGEYYAPFPDFYTDPPPPSIFFPIWPLRSYQKGIQHMPGLGGVQRAFAGNVGSWGKLSHETIEITVNLDRTLNTERPELSQWYELWRSRWRVGQSVSMYFFEEKYDGLVNGTYPGTTLTSNRLNQELHSGGLDFEDETEITPLSNAPWISFIAQCDQLLYVQENPRNAPQRVIDHKSAVSYDGPHKFQRAGFGGGAMRGSRRLWDIK